MTPKVALRGTIAHARAIEQEGVWAVRRVFTMHCVVASEALVAVRATAFPSACWVARLAHVARYVFIVTLATLTDAQAVLEEEQLGTCNTFFRTRPGAGLT